LLVDWSSATSSSSISVVSVPLDVTGDGPTMSLVGLMRWPECALRKDWGRSDCESIDDDVDELDIGA